MFPWCAFFRYRGLRSDSYKLVFQYRRWLGGEGESLGLHSWHGEDIVQEKEGHLECAGCNCNSANVPSVHNRFYVKHGQEYET